MHFKCSPNLHLAGQHEHAGHKLNEFSYLNALFPITQVHNNNYLRITRTNAISLQSPTHTTLQKLVNNDRKCINYYRILHNITRSPARHVLTPYRLVILRIWLTRVQIPRSRRFFFPPFSFYTHTTSQSKLHFYLYALSLTAARSKCTFDHAQAYTLYVILTY